MVEYEKNLVISERNHLFVIGTWKNTPGAQQKRARFSCCREQGRRLDGPIRLMGFQEGEEEGSSGVKRIATVLRWWRPRELRDVARLAMARTSGPACVTCLAFLLAPRPRSPAPRWVWESVDDLRLWSAESFRWHAPCL